MERRPNHSEFWGPTPNYSSSLDWILNCDTLDPRFGEVWAIEYDPADFNDGRNGEIEDANSLPQQKKLKRVRVHQGYANWQAFQKHHSIGTLTPAYARHWEGDERYRTALEELESARQQRILGSKCVDPDETLEMLTGLWSQT